MVHPNILDVEGLSPQVPARRMSEEEFVEWSMASEIRAEWVNGDVILMSPASTKHVLISAWLHRTLGTYIDAKRLGTLMGSDMTVRLHHPVIARRIPDLIFVSCGNLIHLKTNHLEGPPDLAIEIVSPDSVDRDWKEKSSEYEASGVLEYWIIDSITETFQTSIRNAEGRFVNVDLDKDGVFHATTVPGFWLRPEWFWQPDLPDTIQFLRELDVI